MAGSDWVQYVDFGALRTGGGILIVQGAARMRRQRPGGPRAEQVVDTTTYHVKGRTGRVLSSQIPRKITLATGTAGCRQVAREGQAEAVYCVSHETILQVYFDLDLADAAPLLAAVPADIPVLCLHGDEDNAHHGLGLLNKPLAEQKELQHFWQPPEDILHFLADHYLKSRALYPSLVIGHNISGGGHGLAGLRQAAWAAELWPKARRVEIVSVPVEERKRQQLLAVLEMLERLRVEGKPVVDTILLTCDRQNLERQDEMSAHLVGCAESAITSGNQHGDNLGNIWTLPNQQDTGRTHYLTYAWVRSPIPVVRPDPPTFLQRLLGRPQAPSYTDPKVVTEEAFRVANTLVSGRGTPALLAPFDQSVGTALFLGIPSADWDVVEHAKEVVKERLHIKGPIDHNRRGPITGRYDLPATDSTPLVGTLVGEIEGGLEGVKAAINRAPITYSPDAPPAVVTSELKRKPAVRRSS